MKSISRKKGTESGKLKKKDLLKPKKRNKNTTTKAKSSEEKDDSNVLELSRVMPEEGKMRSRMAKKEEVVEQLQEADEGESAESANRVDSYVIDAAELLSMEISLDYNCRHPSRSAGSYKDIRETLRVNPASFLKMNGGIYLANKKYLLDGGHTRLAISDAVTEDKIDPKLIHVRIIDLGDLTVPEMIKRSVALNNRVTPPLRGKRDLEGTWLNIKALLEKKYFKLYEFRPNTQPNAPYKVDFLVALLHAWTMASAERCYSGKGLLVRLYNDEKYSRVLPLLNQAIEFYSLLYKTLIQEKQIQNQLIGFKGDTSVVLPNGEKVKGFLPEAYLWASFGAFGFFIDEKGEWTRDPEKILMDRKAKIVKQILEDFKRCGRNPSKYGKDKGTYLNAAFVITSGA